MICYDVSDLISYFKGARAPTGIQRVQIEVIAASLRGSHDGERTIRICVFSERRGFWIRIPNTFFLKLCDLSLTGGNGSQRLWRAMLRMIGWRIRFARAMGFSPGTALINLGTSWWLPNYFVGVHDAKAKYGIRYIPFIHDLIPLMAPEYCIPGLAQDFDIWISAVFDHADHFLVNSQATRADLLSSAKSLGREVAPDTVTAVPLNADFRKQHVATRHLEQREAHGPKLQDFVFFVSTIESRKNHLGAFAAWLELIRKHGLANTPTLVCVGNEGWLNAAVHEKLNATPALQSRVVILSNVSDDELGALYDDCLFTFYPSHYEGWGLPVTESLCHGKVPLISTASSLPEAGGPFADYFELGSEASMLAALERLTFDGQYRAAREKYIREAFRPRSWIEIGMQIESAAASVQPKLS